MCDCVIIDVVYVVFIFDIDLMDCVGIIFRQHFFLSLLDCRILHLLDCEFTIY
jgi:hypothetical protein